MLHRTRTIGSLVAALLISLPLGAQTGGTGTGTGTGTTTGTTDYGTTQDREDEGGFDMGWLGLLGLLGLLGMRKKDHSHTTTTGRTYDTASTGRT